MKKYNYEKFDNYEKKLIIMNSDNKIMNRPDLSHSTAIAAVYNILNAFPNQRFTHVQMYHSIGGLHFLTDVGGRTPVNTINKYLQDVHREYPDVHRDTTTNPYEYWKSTNDSVENMKRERDTYKRKRDKYKEQRNRYKKERDEAKKERDEAEEKLRILKGKNFIKEMRENLGDNHEILKQLKEEINENDDTIIEIYRKISKCYYQVYLRHMEMRDRLLIRN
jgi:vacuolar-type H+-ATPase subunit I/STV1